MELFAQFQILSIRPRRAPECAKNIRKAHVSAIFSDPNINGDRRTTVYSIIRKFFPVKPAAAVRLLLVTAGGLVALAAVFVLVFHLNRQDNNFRLSAISLDETSGISFPRHSPVQGNWGRLQAMNIVPVQDGGLALQWHLLGWPNPWFERFPLTLDQNLDSARGVHPEENAYWMSAELKTRRQLPESESCPQANPLTPSSSRIWDSTMTNPGQHLGEVWLSDSMPDVEHPDLRGTITVADSGSQGAHRPDAHGTHIAGLMSALRNGEGTVGVVPGLQVKVYPLSVTSTRVGPRISGQDVLASLDAVIMALVSREAKNDNRSRVILLSWAFYESDGLTAEFLEQLESKIERILDFDVALVVPAGNFESGRRSSVQRVFPAAWSGGFHESVGTLLPVSATDVCSRPAWFSQFAANELGITLLAPGERIYSTLTKRDFGFMSGTSASAAQVAAVLAMTSQQYPDVDMKTQVHTLLRTAMPVSHSTERLVSFDAPSLIQGLMAEYGWIARH